MKEENHRWAIPMQPGLHLSPLQKSLWCLLQARTEESTRFSPRGERFPPVRSCGLFIPTGRLQRMKRQRLSGPHTLVLKS